MNTARNDTLQSFPGFESQLPPGTTNGIHSVRFAAADVTRAFLSQVSQNV
jgi:hypothetical protein